MNHSDDEEAPAAEPGKRKIDEVEPKPRPPGDFRYLTSSSALDSFGHVKGLALDKFGALRDPDEERPHVLRRIQTDSSTGSFTPLEPGVGKLACQVTDPSSTWSKYIDVDLENEGTSSKGARIDEAADPSSHSSVPVSCTLHERTSGGPYFAFPEQNEDKSYRNELTLARASELHNDAEPAGVNAAEGSGSLPTAQSRHSFDHSRRLGRSDDAPPTDFERFSNRIDGSSANPLGGRSSSSQYNYHSQDLPRFDRNMESSSSEDARLSRQSTDQYPLKINYRFASPRLEASLIHRMDERQRLQDEAEGEDRACGHVISPEDLIWGSVKHYCGMVLDRETRALLGTAVLFKQRDSQSAQQQQRQQGAAGSTAAESTSSGAGAGAGAGGAAGPRAAWVTCVKVVEGRTEVVIQTSKGTVHVAQLLLTSTTLGVALFSTHVWQGTFALAFLSRVAGPASLPHRLFVDAIRRDRVYVIGYEKPWESESGTVADVRVRPGQIVDAGRYEIVEIDFTAGRLGGSIRSPAGFRGGLVVRADGHLEGVVTGEVLNSHPTNIDFCSAFNIYSLLEEL